MSASTLSFRFRAKCSFAGSFLTPPQDGIFLFISQPVSKYVLQKFCFLLLNPEFWLKKHFLALVVDYQLNLDVYW